MVITYGDDTNSNGEIIVGTVSGTSISFNTAVVINAGAGTSNTTTVYDSAAKNIVSAYKDTGVSNDGYAIVSTTPYTNLSASAFLGISDAAILDTASGNITIKGGIAATGLTSLTPGSDYYAQGDGTISTVSTGSAVKIGKAMSATSINLEYQS